MKSFRNLQEIKNKKRIKLSRFLIYKSYLLLIFILTSCSSLQKQFENSQSQINCSGLMGNNLSEEFTILATKSAFINGVFLVTHGLNNKPEVMNDISYYLNSLGFHVLQIKLKGHTNSSNWPSCLKADDWLNNIKNAYCYSKINFPQLKIFGLGYSLGAAATLAFIEQFENINFEKLVLIAPAIKLRWKVNLIKLLSNFSFLGTKLPSLAPVEYRAHSKTPLSAYSALFEIIRMTSSLKYRFDRIPVMIIQRAEDEIIDFKDTISWAIDNFANPKLTTLEGQEFDKLPQHLMIDRISNSKQSWNKFTSELASFLIQN